MSGKVLQAAVIDLAHVYHWHVAHFHTVRTARGIYITPVAADGKGWPDLFLVRERPLAVEIKGDGDSLSEQQIGWIARLRASGITTHVWTPKDWRSGIVEETLH